MRALCTFAAALLWASPAAAVDVSGNAGLVSDYRYRGVSLSRGRAALQGELALEHDSGLYASLWGSTLGHDADTEVQLGGGYAADLTERIGIDLSANYFVYPSAASDNYGEATGIVTATFGRVSTDLGVSYAPAQRGTGDADNLYAFGAAAYAAPKSPLKLTAAFGYERGAFDEVAGGGKWDWTLGGEVALAPARLGLAYVGSTADGGRRHALVGSVFLDW